MIKKNHISVFYLCLIGTFLVMLSCKSKKHAQQTNIQNQTERAICLSDLAIAQDNVSICNTIQDQNDDEELSILNLNAT